MDELIKQYVDELNATTSTKDVKLIVRRAFEDKRIDDTDFRWLIETAVTPVLESYGANLEKEDASSYEIILSESY